jgi:putative flippase GtrA
MFLHVFRSTLNSARLYCARELFLYLLFGSLAAFTSLLTGRALYGDALFPGLPYWCATAAAAAVGLVVNFVLNSIFNFKFYKRTTFQQFGTFCIVSGFGVVLTSFLSEALLLLLQRNLGDNLHLGHVTLPAKFVANFIAVGLIVLYSFPAHRSISFNVGIRTRLRQLRSLLAAAGRQRAMLKSSETYK